MACEVSEHDTGERNCFTKTKVQGVKGLYPPRVAALARPGATVAAPHPLELMVLEIICVFGGKVLSTHHCRGTRIKDRQNMSKYGTNTGLFRARKHLHVIHVLFFIVIIIPSTWSCDYLLAYFILIKFS
jgi:hypothetical protein